MAGRVRGRRHTVRLGRALHDVAQGDVVGDDDQAAAVLGSTTPREAKVHGRRVRGFDEVIWQAHRWDAVVTGSVAKFCSDSRLRTYLRSTADAVIVEASPVDVVWGIGLAADDDRAADAFRWPGLNLLGFALMEARAQV